MLGRIVLLTAAAAVFQSNLVFAQLGTNRRPPPPPGFATAPKIGELLPDLTLLDDQGNPVSMRELTREKYTVLVLGCLT